jgi:Magnesium chelatase, subunit ChlI
MTRAEAMETTRIHRVAGRTGNRTAFIMTPPCRAPHHTISDAGPIGGGQVPMPGEVSLAHHGILFLDELPEFRRHVLEVLRQPSEESVTGIQSPARHESLYFDGHSRSDNDHKGFGKRAVGTHHHSGSVAQSDHTQRGSVVRILVTCTLVYVVVAGVSAGGRLGHDYSNSDIVDVPDWATPRAWRRRSS